MLQPLPLLIEVETKTVLRKLAAAHKALAELKGVISNIPNENILVETLTLREAKESSAIENIISTFTEVYQTGLFNNNYPSAAAKDTNTANHDGKSHSLSSRPSPCSSFWGCSRRCSSSASRAASGAASRSSQRPGSA